MALNTQAQEEVSSNIFTLANLISLIRLCLVPIFLVLLFDGRNIAATALFAIAAATDFVDGQVARRTHSVSKLGQLLDPAIDRILMIAGVAGLYLVGRLPLWIIVVVLVRDIFLIAGAAYLLFFWKIRIAVVYPGKVATTLLFVGFAGLLLNWPLITGLGLTDAQWLPGFNNEVVSWGIWFIYGGVLLAIGTTVYYIHAAACALSSAKTATSKQERIPNTSEETKSCSDNNGSNEQSGEGGATNGQSSTTPREASVIGE